MLTFIHWWCCESSGKAATKSEKVNNCSSVCQSSIKTSEAKDIFKTNLTKNFIMTAFWAWYVSLVKISAVILWQKISQPNNCIFKKIITIWNNNFLWFFFKVIYQNRFPYVTFGFVYQDLVEQSSARQCNMFKCWNQHFQENSPAV